MIHVICYDDNYNDQNNDVDENAGANGPNSCRLRETLFTHDSLIVKVYWRYGSSLLHINVPELEKIHTEST